jgi:hypothetical protein
MSLLTNDVIAALAMALVFPALLFVAALFLRQFRRADAAPARVAERVVSWYSAHAQLGLWVLLLLMPLAAFVLGSAALLRTWAENADLRYFSWRVLAAIPAHWPAELVGAATVVSGYVLAMMARQLRQA